MCSAEGRGKRGRRRVRGMYKVGLLYRKVNFWKDEEIGARETYREKDDSKDCDVCRLCLLMRLQTVSWTVRRVGQTRI